MRSKGLALKVSSAQRPHRLIILDDSSLFGEEENISHLYALADVNAPSF
jgi:hypothetical protein